MIEPIIWNKRSGNIVGGHQRLKCLDSLEGSPDYLVPVAIVDLSDAEERAQNVFLNNGEAQGEWDLESLQDLLAGLPEVDMTGFDQADLYQLFGMGGAGDADRESDIEEVAESQERGQEWDRRSKEKGEREQGDFFCVVVFGSDEERTDFLAAMGLPDNRYVDGKRLRSILGR